MYTDITVKNNILENVLAEYTEQLKKIYGSSLHTIVLFGSYARGDYHANSDIDIVLLLALSDDKIKALDDALCELTFNMNMKYDLDIQPITINIEQFNKWKDVHPFYKNVSEEGVHIYDAA